MGLYDDDQKIKQKNGERKSNRKIIKNGFEKNN